MSTLDNARMPSLKDKLSEQEELRAAALAKAEEADEADVEDRKGKGRRIKSKTKN